VTHSLGQVYELCTSAILLSHGELVTQGEPRLVGYAYEQILAGDRVGRRVDPTPVARAPVSAPAPVDTPAAAPTESGNTEVNEHAHVDVGERSDEAAAVSQGESNLPSAELVACECLNEAGIPVQTLYHGESYTMRLRLVCHRRVPRMAVGYRMQLPSGLVVYGVSSVYLGKLFSGAAGETLEVDFSFDCYLQSGVYLLGGGVAEYHTESEFTVVHALNAALQLTVISSNRFQGVADLRSRIVDKVPGRAIEV